MLAESTPKPARAADGDEADEPAPDNVLAAGEGLETVLAAMALRPPPFAAGIPAWACLSADNLAKLPLVPGVEHLIVLADNDEPGRKAVDRVAAAWRGAGRTVTVLLPPLEGQDFNDVLREGAHAA